MQVDLRIPQNGPNELWGDSLLNYSLLPQCAEEHFGPGAWSTSSFFTDFSAAMLVLLTCLHLFYSLTQKKITVHRYYCSQVLSLKSSYRILQR